MRVPPRQHRSRGFSLVEILVVLIILGAVITMVVPRLQRQKFQTQEVLRKLSAVSRELTQSARLQNRTFRLAIRMPPLEKPGPASYWVESSGDRTLVKTAEQKEEEARNTRAADAKPAASSFAIDGNFFKEPRQLPSEVKVLSVQTPNDAEPITSGLAYVHFFSVGLAEEAVIQLSISNTARWTLVVDPVTGQTEIYDREISLKDLRSR